MSLTAIQSQTKAPANNTGAPRAVSLPEWSRSKPTAKPSLSIADRFANGAVASQAGARPKLGDYLVANGGATARQEKKVFYDEVDRIFNSNSLDHLPVGRQIGRGNFKDAYEIAGSSNALIVNQKYSHSMRDELVMLWRLQNIGVPVAPILGLGKYKGEEAMIQPRFEHMIKFKESASLGFDLLKTGAANRNTIESLKKIRDAVQREQIVIGDLQGGIVSDKNSPDYGKFLVTDPIGIEKADNSPYGFSNVGQVNQINTAIGVLEQTVF